MSSITRARILGSLRRRADILENNLQLAASWRGQKPRIYLCPGPTQMHSVWRTYQSHPLLRYAPFPLAQVCHWVARVPAASCLHKPHVFELEHVAALARDTRGGRGRRYMCDWFRIWEDNDYVQQLLASDKCRVAFTFSAGMVEHWKTFLPPALWPKLDFVYPAFPSQPEFERKADGQFNILVIASRWSDKGMPEAMRAFEILRARHGQKVRLTLVSQDVPPATVFPDGVTHHDVPRMSPEFKARMYQEADVLFLPCYSETAACFVEAYAFGVPVVTTRIHHGDEFVREGKTGFLVQAPLFPYSEGFGTRWRTWEDFLADVIAMRERGELESVVEESVAALDILISGQSDIAEMRRAARELHQECFSPQARNQKLARIYERALGRSVVFPGLNSRTTSS